MASRLAVVMVAPWVSPQKAPRPLMHGMLQAYKRAAPTAKIRQAGAKAQP